MNDTYTSPFSQRYASKYMTELFSPYTRIKTWRKLWTSLAAAQSKLGLNITEQQVKELRDNIENIDFECAKQREKQVRHDVMAHIYAYSQVAPSAAGIIHLGATSCFVTDNADLVIYRDALIYIRNELKKVIANLCDFATEYKSTPTLGYTHYQPAQLVTVGKRASLWLQDFMFDYDELNFVIENLKFRGCQGTTGSCASLLELFGGNSEKIKELNKMIANDFGFEECYDVCSQTYSRKVDSRILNVLSAIAQSASKMANDIRLLQHDRLLFEPFEKDQIGSSAMPYKRNPMRCERICSLSRYLMTNSQNASSTAAVQWLERTLDDSAIRRISMPEGFLCADAILRLAQNVTSNLVVNENAVNKKLKEYLPFIATENLMMEGVKKGASRQELHAIIRECSLKAIDDMDNGLECNLLSLLANREDFPLDKEQMEDILDPMLYIGLSAKQVEDLVEKLKPITDSADRNNAQIDV